MKILIFGGNGQLGRCLQATFSIPGTELIAPTRDDLSIEDFPAVDEFITQVNPDFVVNAAAWTDVPGAEESPEDAMRLNCDAVSNLALVCRKAGATLIHISTDYVFDGAHKEAYDENAVTNPLNEYGKSKLAGETAIVASGISNYYIIRTSWLYSKYGKNFVKTIASKSLKNEPVSIIDDQFGSPTFAGDLAQGIKSVIETRSASGIYHFSNSGTTNWFEFGRLIYQQTLNNPELVSTRKTGQKELKRPPFSQLSMEKWKLAGLVTPTDWKISLERELSEIIVAIKEEVK